MGVGLDKLVASLQVTFGNLPCVLYAATEWGARTVINKCAIIAFFMGKDGNSGFKAPAKLIHRGLHLKGLPSEKASFLVLPSVSANGLDGGGCGCGVHVVCSSISTLLYCHTLPLLYTRRNT